MLFGDHPAVQTNLLLPKLVSISHFNTPSLLNRRAWTSLLKKHSSPPLTRRVLPLEALKPLLQDDAEEAGVEVVQLLGDAVQLEEALGRDKVGREHAQEVHGVEDLHDEADLHVDVVQQEPLPVTRGQVDERGVLGGRGRLLQSQELPGEHAQLAHEEVAQEAPGGVGVGAEVLEEEERD